MDEGSTLSFPEASLPMNSEQTDPCLCLDCGHPIHNKGHCEVLFFYTRGPNDLPGNQRCLCGYDLPTLESFNNSPNGIIN